MAVLALVGVLVALMWAVGVGVLVGRTAVAVGANVEVDVAETLVVGVEAGVDVPVTVGAGVAHWLW